MEGEVAELVEVVRNEPHDGEPAGAHAVAPQLNE